MLYCWCWISKWRHATSMFTITAIKSLPDCLPSISPNQLHKWQAYPSKCYQSQKFSEAWKFRFSYIFLSAKCETTIMPQYNFSSSIKSSSLWKVGLLYMCKIIYQKRIQRITIQVTLLAKKCNLLNLIHDFHFDNRFIIQKLNVFNILWSWH